MSLHDLFRRFPQALLGSLAIHCAVIAALAAVLIMPHRRINRGVAYIYLLNTSPGGSRTPHPSEKVPASIPSKPVPITRPSAPKHIPRLRKRIKFAREKESPQPQATLNPSLESMLAPPGNIVKPADGLGDGARNNAAGADGLSDGPLSADQVDQPPAIILAPLPDYPETARRRSLEGEVVLRIIVDQNGAVDPHIDIVESIPPLNQAAIDAVRKWRFSPGRDREGRPVRVLLEIPLRFALRDSE